jgi:hypothetical protein
MLKPSFQKVDLFSYLFSFLIYLSFRPYLLFLIFPFLYIRFGIKFRYSLIYIFYFLFVLIISTFVFTFGAAQFSATSIISGITKSQTVQEWKVSDNASTVTAVIGGFENWSIPKKLVMIPVLIATQYLTPVNFWATNSDYAYEFISINMNIIWFIFTGPLFIFAAFFFRFNEPVQQRMSLTACSFYILMAFIFGGVIPRYAAPVLPLILISIAAASYAIISQKKVRARWLKFYMVYCFAGLAGGLALFLFKILN